MKYIIMIFYDLNWTKTNKKFSGFIKEAFESECISRIFKIDSNSFGVTERNNIVFIIDIMDIVSKYPGNLNSL